MWCVRNGFAAAPPATDWSTGVSTSNTGAVLDGDLDEFMGATLAQKAFGDAPNQVEDVD